jgi:glycosyltransferase involved in cell wall biosynthesis
MHYLSILAILKNEAMNLKVWIDHYLWQGVDHLYLIDNGSTDDSVTIIQSLISQGYPITLYELPEKHKQLDHYHYVYDRENIRQNSKWLAVIDLDEFIYCHNSTMKNELQKYEHIDYIGMRWRFFGTNGYDKHPSDIRIALTTRKENMESGGKYIFQPKNVESQYITVHYLLGGYSRWVDLSEIFRLNHYVIQSKEFFEKVKMTRGDASGECAEYIRDWKYFEEYNKNTTYMDEDLKNMVLNK